MTRSLGTSDLYEAKARAHAELTQIDRVSAQARVRLDLNRASLTAKRISTMGDEQRQVATEFWVR
ncbi:hypothetical protein [Janthinobacterium sp. LB3P112]|uniref:hypothetical protein n=1 Tax=Janthinobacterium sp. LB3P112 TaxID=3424196 RepID=UPI003F223142